MQNCHCVFYALATKITYIDNNSKHKTLTYAVKSVDIDLGDFNYAA